MNREPAGNIAEFTFCANPKYELVLLDQLPAEQREVLKELQNDPNFYGILRPREKSGLGVKSVSRDTALLFLTLQRPGKLPGYMRATLGEQCSREAARLVLDGVLAVERNGKFVSGPDAAVVVTDEPAADSDDAFVPEGFLELLSIEALRYGQSLRLDDAMALSGRLYGFNRLPLSPYWKRTLRDIDAVEDFLGMRTAMTRGMLEGEWLRVQPPAGNDGWLAWQSRRALAASRSGDGGVQCKLYISPRPECLPEFFPAILAALTQTNVKHFKVGKDAAGLLRPDKLVAYFCSHEDLMETAQRIKEALTRCMAHGVPFTAGLSEDGLLSWGTDPPAQGQVLPWLGIESWRLWVTNRLAVAMIAGASADTREIEPWQFALRRLQFEGVDTRSWIPAVTSWKKAEVPEGQLR